jgi:pyruvate/2-oxoglutarate/acetoin dehydrogenase E1 component
VPLDTETIITSIKKTGRLLVVEESNERGGWGGEVVSAVANKAIGYVDAPLRRLATPDVPIPFSPALEAAVVPNEEKIRAEILELVGAQL